MLQAEAYSLPFSAGLVGTGAKLGGLAFLSVFVVSTWGVRAAQGAIGGA